MRLQFNFDFYFNLVLNPLGTYILSVETNRLELYFMNWYDYINENKDNSIFEYENTNHYISFRFFGLTFVHYH